MNKRLLNEDEIKDILYEMLILFSDFCDKNQLVYSLCGGTLLGAVRHQDFIPWDDDVDVFMPRKDYEKFIRIFPEKGIGTYKMICLENNLSTYPFAKIIDLCTKIIRKSKFSQSEDTHIWIDIFPVDGVPKEMKNCKKIWNAATRIRKKYLDCQAILGTGTTRFRALAKMPKVLWHKMHGSAYYGKELSEFCKKIPYGNSEMVAEVAWNTQMGSVFRRKAFDGRIKVLFHGKEFWAISEWDEYLTGMYGDYMQMPAENERMSHSFTAVKEK